MAIELEKKYRLTAADREEIIALLDEFGAERLGEDIEENVIFGNDLLASVSSVIRIRTIGERSVLTFKKRLPGNGDIKQQVEEETPIGDAAGMTRILGELGIVPRLVYEKRREKFRFRSTEVVIDELPFGLYMEIEGTLTGIREAEMLLDAERFEYEPETYPRLTARLGKQRGSIIEARFQT